MKHSTGNPTKADRARFDALQNMGCIVSRLYLNRFAQADIHHLLSGNKRRGHQYTIPLSPWFHRGIPPIGLSAMQAAMIYGPSLAKSSKRFREMYGDDDSLLAEVNELLNKQRTT